MVRIMNELRDWLRSSNVDPAEITVVLRAETPEQEMRLTQALANEYIKNGTRDIEYPTARAYALRVAGLDVIVTTLDASARRIERGSTRPG